ncbi:hypothetical protein [Halopiger xanaduensis]|uniref:Glycoside hydrolase family 42 domain protein n=1 Tax=Halopiger xanaduensis (strain DSM 18323 / JCM 14033 / SH-6) TaxID=797210 RepID=F8DDX7_HALXS|nr:hypothetical protein [Halopiger xanaduensis]AEH39232.1 hypothetical protein Halxa_0653 [Halopiger xanaduensis SH-6]
MSDGIPDMLLSSSSVQPRRGFLATLTASASLPIFSSGSGAVQNNQGTSTDIPLQNTSGQTQSEIPPYPDDPFIQPAYGIQYILGWENHGWESVSSEQIQQTVLGLHPDVLAFDQLLKYEDGEIEFSFPGGNYRAQLNLAQDLELPATSGMNVHIASDEAEARSRYGPIIEESEWAFPDGTPVESPQDILGRTFDGNPHETAYEFETLGTPSVFAPGGLELMLHATVTQLEKGYSGFFIDGVGVFRLHGLDFSRWARAAFRTHLQSLSEARLSTLSINDPESFDIREYLKANDLTPDDDIDPREDPVFREYLLHQHQGIDNWFDDYRKHINEQFPERTENGDLVLYANQFTGNLQNPQAPNIYISDSMDVIYTELFPTGDPAADVNYKIMRSVGNFSKPVLAKGTLAPAQQRLPDGMDTDSSNTMFQRFQLAEAYSTGTRLQLPLTNRMGYSEEDSVTNWVGPNGTVPDELSSFIDFVWAHKRFLTDIEPAGNIALIWSLPTHVWRREPSWQISDDGEEGLINSFTRTARILREAGFTYDVLTFGHPRLWDDSIQLDRLKEYETVVLAGVECVSDRQVSALQTYLDNGGTVLCTGPVPDRDAMYEPRSDVAAIFDSDNATVLDGVTGTQRESQDESLLSVLADSGVDPTRQMDDSNIAIHSHSQSDPDRYVIPLVNYDYDPETDSFSTKSDIRVRLPKMDSMEFAVRYYSPVKITDLGVSERDGSPYVTVPELVEWGFIVVAKTREDLEPTTSEQSALDAVENARESLEKAKEQGQSTDVALVTAKSKLQAAEIAMSFDSYEQAKAAAAEAIDAVVSDGTDEEGVSDDQNTTDSSGTDTQDVTADDTSGFGIASTATALGSVAYLLKSRLTDAETDSS